MLSAQSKFFQKCNLLVAKFAAFLLQKTSPFSLVYILCAGKNEITFAFSIVML